MISRRLLKVLAIWTATVGPSVLSTLFISPLGLYETLIEPTFGRVITPGLPVRSSYLIRTSFFAWSTIEAMRPRSS